MMKNGMNVARLNFSHGTHDQHRQLIKNIRLASQKSGRDIAILQDLQGPKMRVGVLPKEGVQLVKGHKISFKSGDFSYEEHGPFPVTHTTLHKDVKKGHRIFLDDGKIEVVVESVRGTLVKAKVLFGGTLTSHKGMNLPDSIISTSSFTKKDREDLLFGLEQGVDWVALSFVTSDKVVKKVRTVIQEHVRKGGIPPRIIVKIERQEAIDSFVSILQESDGIMLARGDLGVELPPEEVPIIQKEFVEVCRQAGKPIVVATQMLESMTESPRATRAEISDVANAVIDHADAVMLSGETATGDFPDVTVRTMDAVIEEAENSRLDDIVFYQIHDIPDIETSLAQTVHVMAENNQIDAIVSSVSYGEIAQMINVFRPNVPIFLAANNDGQARQMLIKAGVYAFTLKDSPGTFIHRAEGFLRKQKMITKKSRVAYLTATPQGTVQLTVK